MTHWNRWASYIVLIFLSFALGIFTVNVAPIFGVGIIFLGLLAALFTSDGGEWN